MQETIQYIKTELTESYPKQEIEAFVRLIFESVLGLNYTDIIIQKDKKIGDSDFGQIKTIIARLKTYEPIQYILGKCEFYGLKINVNPAVLIPRPETEELVNWIVQTDIKDGANILDIGTGSGCIALALKNKLPKTQVSGVDISEKALEVAKKNADENYLNVDFSRADILNWKKLTWNTYDVIVSNPPYVRNCEKKWMEKNVLEYEPDGALFVENDNPLVFYSAIADFAMQYLSTGGYLFFEINEYLGSEMENLLNELGFSEIEIRKDINGKNRMLLCRKFE